MTVSEATKKVEPEKIYTATDVIRQELIPWVKSSRLLTKILETGIIPVHTEGEGTARRYLMKGEDLQNYIKTHGLALMPFVPKHYANSKKRNLSK